MALKYVVDATVIGMVAGVVWTPVDYLVPLVTFSGDKLAHFPAALNVFLLVWTLPFIWIGVALSVRRALDADLFPGLVIAFFVPFLNYALMLALSWMPTAPSRRFSDGVHPDPHGGSRRTMSTHAGILAGVAGGVAMCAVSVVLLQAYGGALFLGVPFAIGAVSAFVANRIQPRPLWESLLVGQAAVAVTGGIVILFMMEGLICLAMAIPIAAPLALLGSVVGAAAGLGSVRPSAPQSMLVLLVFPLGAAIEASATSAAARIVLTAIEIDAPPAAVWTQVVSFSDIAAAPSPLLRTGLAYPLRARIDGSGAGAVRRCEFTTGSFVEPITVWDEPRRLAFDVAAQPPPLREWSPYARVYAPHLDGFFRTTHGEFRLVPLDGGRTRLEGRTWYRLDMQPALYWTAIADGILHAIHQRVLIHVKASAETPRG